jgi:hypothetical protein
MRRVILSLVSIVLSNSATSAFAGVPTDFDGDGTSDLTIVEITQSDTLDWKVSLSSTGALSGLGALGQNGNHVVTAQWLSTGTQIGVVSEQTSGDGIVWSIVDTNGARQERVFGKKGDLVIAGADVNGNGTADAVVVRLVKRKAQWEIAYDPFLSEAPVTQTLSFGKDGDRAFFARLDDSGGDWIGVLGKAGKNRSRARMRNLLTSEVRTFNRLPKFASHGARPRAFPVRQASGADLLGFQTTSGSGTKLSFFAFTGARVMSQNFQGSGTAVVGEFDTSPGFEVAYQSEAESVVFNPVVGEVRAAIFLGGIPVDEININVLGTASGDTPGGGAGGGGSGGGGSGGGSVAQCSSVLGWPGSHIYKTIGSTHFSPGDVRRNTIGLVIRPGGRGPFPSCINAVDSTGTVVAQLGLYSRNDGWTARYYAGFGCGTGTPFNGAAVASRARANTGSPNIYMNFDGVCFGPIDAGTCVGSSQC